MILLKFLHVHIHEGTQEFSFAATLSSVLLGIYYVLHTIGGFKYTINKTDTNLIMLELNSPVHH